MDVLYLYKSSKWGKELKFSLRSVQKYVDLEKVYVVGDKPDWIQNVVHIPCQHLPNRFEDVNNKMKVAFEHIPYLNHVLLMQDDIYLTEPYVEKKYYNGLLKDAKVGGGRKQAFENTLMHVVSNCKNYGIHYPMPFLSTLEWNYDEPVSYMNILGDWYVCDSVESEDCKFKNPTENRIKSFPCFSTHSESDHLLPLMLKLYPEKSTFEL